MVGGLTGNECDVAVFPGPVVYLSCVVIKVRVTNLLRRGSLVSFATMAGSIDPG